MINDISFTHLKSNGKKIIAVAKDTDEDEFYAESVSDQTMAAKSRTRNRLMIKVESDGEVLHQSRAGMINEHPLR